MKKKITILVPTDFSAASRAGMRFAIQWAKQWKAELIFTHVLSIMRPTRWSPGQFETFAASQRALTSQRLNRLAAEVCRDSHAQKLAYTTQVVEGMSADITLTELGEQRQDIDVICMSTTGAGKIKKLLGTHTGNLIQHSPLPVIAVPANYRTKPIRSILYASDLADSDAELERVLQLGRELKAEITVVHFRDVPENLLAPELVTKVWQKEYGYPLKLRYETYDPALSLAENLQGVIRRSKPSLVVMFTNRQRNFLQRLLYPSQAEKVSFRLQVPLMVFGKGSAGV